MLVGFPALYFNDEGDAFKLLAISQWGGGMWRSMQRAFNGCQNLSISATDAATALTENVSNFMYARSGCSGLTTFPSLNTSAGAHFGGAWQNCTGLTTFPLLNFGKMEKGENCFAGVTLASDSYGELLANTAALNKVSNVTFDGGLSKAQGLIGIQAREKLTKKMGWPIADGDDLNPKPMPKKARPAKIKPQPLSEEANDF